MIDLKLATPRKIIFEEKVGSVVFPGESGYFEVLPFHKPLLSRLMYGAVTIDRKWTLAIKRGIVKIEGTRATAIVEVEAEDGS